MLTIKLDNNGSFTDYSSELENYIQDSLAHTFVSAEDALYVGYYKPIAKIYVEMTTANANDVSLTVERNTGSLSSVSAKDKTNGLQRSGFISWERSGSEVKSTIDGVELYWYKLTFSGDTSAMVINGINLVFSDDIMLKEVEPAIADFLYSNDASFIRFHQSARNEIIQRINNSGKFKINSQSKREKLNQWDFLSPEDLAEASKYLTLSRIFESLSDSIDDNYAAKYSRYYSQYQDHFNLYMTSYDIDDDGVLDTHENNRTQHGKIVLV